MVLCVRQMLQEQNVLKIKVLKHTVFLPNCF